MKKIGIITLFGYTNYGNRLQMYASQKIYEKLGFEAEILKHDLNITLLRKCKRTVKFFLNFFLKKNKLEQEKMKRFRQHTEKYIIESKEIINSEKVDIKLKNRYDFFSVGSDQIWSPDNYYRLDFIFLKFADMEQRISLSPSIGKVKVPDELKNEYRLGLNGFNQITVREEEGAKIIKEISNKDALVLLDPTMVISREEWEGFSERHEKKPLKKYILTYFLGPLPIKVREIIEDIKDYEIIQLASLEMPEYYATNPSEWVDFINSADLFLTDSFHGVVFSHVLKTPFVVYERIGGKSMGSRITTILKKFNMEHRYELSKNSLDLFDVDFSNVDFIIEEEKEKVVKFLKKVLNINYGNK